MKSINFRNASIPITITYKDAMFTFREYGLNLLEIFKDEAVIGNILTDDSMMITIWHHYVSSHCSSLEDAIEDLTTESMVEFRDAFLDAVVNFINPQMRPVLTEILREMKKELASPGTKLKKALSESSVEQE